jgi:hypothetical protein
VNVFRPNDVVAYLNFAQGREGFEVLEGAEGVCAEAGRRRRSCGEDLSQDWHQPGDVFQLKEEV